MPPLWSDYPPIAKSLREIEKEGILVALAATGGYKAQAADCTLHPLPNGNVEVHFRQPLRDIAPGQGAIFYDGDLCLGGVIIAK